MRDSGRPNPRASAVRRSRDRRIRANRTPQWILDAQAKMKADWESAHRYPPTNYYVPSEGSGVASGIAWKA